MEIFFIALCAVVFLLAILVFSPIVVAVDSRNRQVRVRWLYALEFHLPLPWTGGEKRLYVFRKAVPLKEWRRVEKLAKLPAESPQPRKKRRAFARFFTRCLGDSTIRRTLARQVAKLFRRIFGSVDLSRWASDISLPDPALNGMLAGALAATSRGASSGTRVNFDGENSLFLEFRFHPHRVFKAFLLFLPGLPYRAMFRVWRALPAAR